MSQIWGLGPRSTRGGGCAPGKSLFPFAIRAPAATSRARPRVREGRREGAALGLRVAAPAATSPARAVPRPPPIRGGGARARALGGARAASGAGSRAVSAGPRVRGGARAGAAAGPAAAVAAGR